MGRICRYVPPNWESFIPMGEVIPRTRFIVFKTPLNDRLLTKVSKERRFNVSILLRKVAENNQKLGLVIDLTDTTRYYDKKDIEGMCIAYEKISCPGRGFVDNDDAVISFNNAIQQYTERSTDPEALIGVHCTDGINRSGYLVCRFLIENLGWSSHEALEAFERSRGHPIANGSYVQELHKAAKKTREAANRRAEGNADENSESESDSRRKKKKKNKRKRELEDEEGNVGSLMQQFLGEIEQQAQEIQAAVESPMGPIEFVDSPRQKHWAFTNKRPRVEDRTKHVEAKIEETTLTASFEQSTTFSADFNEGNDDEAVYDEVEGDVKEEGMTKAQKRRARKARQQKMLNVMRRGNFHEIQEMQEEYMMAKGSQLTAVNLLLSYNNQRLKIQMTSRYVVHPETLVYGKRQYRAPFKVDFTVWCPRSELLIVASKKGDVILQRNGWKKCWRVSLTDQCDPLSEAEPEASRTIECITWAPSGDIIAIGTSDGHVNLMYADNGIIFWKKLLSEPGLPLKITSLHWSSKSAGEDFSAVFDDEKGAPLSFPQTDDASWIPCLQGIEDTFRQKLCGTLIFASRDDQKVSVLAGGVLSIGLIDLNLLLGPLRLVPVLIYGTNFDVEHSFLAITFLAHGPKTVWRKNNVFIKPAPGSGEKMAQSNIVNIPLEVPSTIWKLVYRYVTLYNRYVHAEETLHKLLKDWQTQKQIFINRLIPTAKNLNLGACLVSFCLHGHGTHLGDQYIERIFTTNLSGLVEFVYRTFDQLASCLNGEFSEAVRMVSFHMEEFAEELLTEYTDDEETVQLLKKISGNMESMSSSFQKSVSITVKACVHNIGELLQFIRWLSVLPVEKEGKKKLAVFPQLAKLDMSSELKFLIETFIDDEDTGRRLKDHCFNIDKVLEKERLLEREGYYEETNKATKKDLNSQKIKEEDECASHTNNTQVMEDETPRANRTSHFRKSDKTEKSTPLWQEKLDKVSELWTKDDYFSSELLKRLGLNSVENQKVPNIKKQCLYLKKLLYALDAVVQHSLEPLSIDWLCELECGQAHNGFKSVEMKPITIDQQASILLRRKQSHLIPECIMICGFDKSHAIVKVIGCTFTKDREFSWMIREDFTKSINKGFYMECAQESEPKNALQIDTVETHYGKIIGINELRGRHDGFFFVLVTVEKADRSEMRHLLRYDVTQETIWIHHVPFRYDQFETLSFQCKNALACCTSDDGTRVNMFSTNVDSDPVECVG